MNAFALHDVSDQAVLRRWGVSAMAIVAAHAALIALAMNWYTQRPEPGVAVPAIMVDLAPITSSPEAAPMDMMPGPEMQQADASPPEPAAAEAVPEQIAPTPPQEKPEVVAPPEQKLEPTPQKPEPTQIVPDHKPVPVKSKIVRPDARKPSEAPPAPRTSAPPRAERQAPAASAMSAGAAASAMATYIQQVRAHLMRFHKYPSGHTEQGVVKLAFTLGRNGQLVTGRVGGSSGVAAFDAQAMALLRQAQPFPAFPPEITYSTMPVTVPVAFRPR
jgi:periplasmic protein TonB